MDYQLLCFFSITHQLHVLLHIYVTFYAAVIQEWGGVWELHSHPTLPLITFHSSQLHLVYDPEYLLNILTQFFSLSSPPLFSSFCCPFLSFCLSNMAMKILSNFNIQSDVLCWNLFSHFINFFFSLSLDLHFK